MAIGTPDGQRGLGGRVSSFSLSSFAKDSQLDGEVVSEVSEEPIDTNAAAAAAATGAWKEEYDDILDVNVRYARVEAGGLALKVDLDAKHSLPCGLLGNAFAV